MMLGQNSYIKKLGPGIITAALVFGPGSLTINTKLGASFGFSLLWVLVLAMVFMSVFTRMSAKVGLASKVSFIKRIKQELGKPLAILVGIGVFLTTASFQAGNSIGASVAFAELFSTSYVLWLALFTALAIGLLFFESFYKILEKVMIGLVVLMLA
ncbi:MAG: Nramp family divalent metal transporter, partial [Cyclobacteriaceae bacterium]|nr:Nramp family divalent metal transporter [Cyclobacteriaceae bacterium]